MFVCLWLILHVQCISLFFTLFLPLSYSPQVSLRIIVPKIQSPNEKVGLLALTVSTCTSLAHVSIIVVYIKVLVVTPSTASLGKEIPMFLLMQTYTVSQFSKRQSYQHVARCLAFRARTIRYMCVHVCHELLSRVHTVCVHVHLRL